MKWIGARWGKFKPESSMILTGVSMVSAQDVPSNPMRRLRFFPQVPQVPQGMEIWGTNLPQKKTSGWRFGASDRNVDLYKLIDGILTRLGTLRPERFG